MSQGFTVGGRCHFNETTSMCGIDGVVRERKHGTVMAIGSQSERWLDGWPAEEGAIVAWDDGRVTFCPFWNRRFEPVDEFRGRDPFVSQAHTDAMAEQSIDAKIALAGIDCHTQLK